MKDPSHPDAWHAANVRTALALNALLWLLGLSAIITLYKIEQNLAQTLRQQKAEVAQWEQRLRDIDQERQDIQTHLPLLQRLTALGAYGEEPRLEWVELLQTIEKERAGLQISYDIEAQQGLALHPHVDPPPAQNPSPARTLASFYTDMHLKLRVRHEGDVPYVLDRLQQAHLGYAVPTYCRFQHALPPEASPTLSSALPAQGPQTQGLAVSCGVRWYSMRLTNRPQGAAP